jgi:hypothetical protein
MRGYPYFKMADIKMADIRDRHAKEHDVDI